MQERVEIIKAHLLSHKVESVFFGMSLLIFTVSLIMFTQVKIDRAGKNTIIIHKSNTGAGSVMVDVGGAVKKPGVYAIQTGQRTYELIDKAGGLTEDADLSFFDKNINRAQKLNDQVKIYIPFKTSEKLLQPVELFSSSLTSINSAAVSELESLPEVGEVTAKKIIISRPYSSIDDLLSKKVLKSNVYEKIRSLITL